MSKKGEKVLERADKATMAEIEYRVSQVYSWILNGASYGDIVRDCANLWGIRKRASENLMRRAREEIGRVSDEDKAYAFGLAEKRLNNLYMISRAKGDIKTCLAVQRELSELFGLKQDRNFNPNINIKFEGNADDYD